jgi:alpha-aminoadipic semialdehyde synthase
MGDFIAGENEKLFEQVFKDIRAEISDVGIIIDGRTAGVKFDYSGNDGFKRLKLPAQGVKKLNHDEDIIRINRNRVNPPPFRPLSLEASLCHNLMASRNKSVIKTIIGIRREDKNLWERRAPLIPAHVREIIQNHHLDIWIQPSSIRIFPEEDYIQAGAKVEEGLNPCSVIFAIKEIPLNIFRKEGVYVFFSHTTKGQPHNMPMLQKMKDLRCTLIDYERIMDEKGQRLLFFGRQAGQAGMIDTLWTLGRRLNQEKKKSAFSSIKQAFRYASLVEAKEDIQKVGWKISREGIDGRLVPLLFGFAGYGHVSQGAQEIFNLLPYEDIEPEKIPSFFEEKSYSSHKVYKSVFKEIHTLKPKSAGRKFELQDYFDNPDQYDSVFSSYLPYLSVFVNCIFWTPKHPRLVTKEDLRRLYSLNKKPRLKVIGDISCDIEGAVECTLHVTNPDKPVYVYDPVEDKAVDGVKGRGPVVLAIDNLPAEIPLESSVYFSSALKPYVAEVARADFTGNFKDCRLLESIQKAVILFRGSFTPGYEYMKSFIK